MALAIVKNVSSVISSAILLVLAPKNLNVVTAATVLATFPRIAHSRTIPLVTNAIKLVTGRGTAPRHQMTVARATFHATSATAPVTSRKIVRIRPRHAMAAAKAVTYDASAKKKGVVTRKRSITTTTTTNGPPVSPPHRILSLK